MKFSCFNVLTLAALTAALPLSAQAGDEAGCAWKGNPSQQVTQAKTAGAQFETVHLFSQAADLSMAQAKSSQWSRFSDATEVLAAATFVSVDFGASKAFSSSAPDAMTVRLPLVQERRGSLDLELVKVNLFGSQFKVVTSSGKNADYELGQHYRGVVKGSEESLVALSIYSDQVIGMVVEKDLGTVNIGRLQGDQPGNQHVIYKAADFVAERNISCGNEYAGHEEISLTPQEQPAVLFQEPLAGLEKALSDCVGLYYETDLTFFNHFGSVNGVVNFITGMQNQVGALYSNENINTNLSELKVWDTTDPYANTNSGGQLRQSFAANKGSFNGDLAQLLRVHSNGNGWFSGQAAGFNGLCNPNNDESKAATALYPTYNTVPTYSDVVNVVTHEFGHLFGSRHTHACVWNGNNTAIDGCAATEGSCRRPSFPQGGGTIMSYCHQQSSVGIDFNKGFGTQPGNTIRNRVANASCLSACDGGGDPPAGNSCVGRCGNQAPDGCYCDSACHGFGDCCPDKVAACGNN